jgi:hypothetical protein
MPFLLSRSIVRPARLVIRLSDRSESAEIVASGLIPVILAYEGVEIFQPLAYLMQLE